MTPQVSLAWDRIGDAASKRLSKAPQAAAIDLRESTALEVLARHVRARTAPAAMAASPVTREALAAALIVVAVLPEILLTLRGLAARDERRQPLAVADVVLRSRP